jgi:SAM-dependent methyltransferase
MRNHLQGIANEVVQYIGEQPARVLDIGCNDGTLLKGYPAAYEKWGVDPSDVALEIQGDVRVVQDTFPSRKLDDQLAGEKFDVITSIAMFYDLEDPVAFVRCVAASLKPQGLWVFEMSYMPTMLKMDSYDTICHEHLEYYSLAVLENIARRAGVKIVRVELNDVNGGSIRCYATHLGNHKFQPNPLMADLRQQEFDLELDTDKPYRAMQERIEKHRDDLRALLITLKAEGKRIHIYGASTKGNTLLQWCGIDTQLVDCAAERNPDKYGAKTLGTNIPIVSEAESRAMNPDYYLVLPWHFKPEFLERERGTLDRGVGMIFPLPKVEVVQRDRSVVKAGR